MKKMKACLIITAITLTVYGMGHSAGAQPVRPGPNVSTTSGVAPRPATPSDETPSDESKCDACCDPSEHKVSFVTVAPGVQLEVLDWGGTGEPLILLTGGGDNAHVYDNFAYQFTDKFHVIGITRRGFGKSSQPASGYDLDTRARDVIAVLDALNIRRALFIGHSIAGTELYKLGAAYPNRVKKIVSLDGLDNGSGGWTSLPQPPGPPELTPWDLESVQRLAAASVLTDGFRPPLASLCNQVMLDSPGGIVGPVTPPEISGKINAGLQPAQYERIKAPALGIFNRITPQYRLPYYPYLNPAQKQEYARSIRSLVKWVDGAIQRFRSGVKNGRVIELHDANHYAYIVDEGFVVREIREFLLAK